MILPIYIAIENRIIVLRSLESLTEISRNENLGKSLSPNPLFPEKLILNIQIQRKYMSFVNAIRSILQEAGEPLTAAEIRQRIQNGYPHLYGTQSHVENYPTIDHGVIAQVLSTARNARDLIIDKTVKPRLISLESMEIEADIVIEDDSGVDEKDKLDAELELKQNSVFPAPAPPRSNDHFKLEWTRCLTYEDAQNFSYIIYLHEWHGEPFYWGIARTYFGGSRRMLGEGIACGRYNSGYRHWIEGSLRHGGRLYVARIIEGDQSRLQEVENYLICSFGHQANRRETAVLQDLSICHSGGVPLTITSHLFFNAA